MCLAQGRQRNIPIPGPIPPPTPRAVLILKSVCLTFHQQAAEL